ncbi:uncharacterized protein LOC121854962 [Homarus americanus]|uniref:uncharacterized protein LOC121854962 n=1 Tax=Homarus americanus TaxID=6706 RepID=UPI001C47657C|nr:uncharacterized protein LOC121854962 [Homarus americanus]
MCKTCRRPLHCEGNKDLGPWGLRGAYKSVALTSRRLWTAQHHRDEEKSEEQGSSARSSSELLVNRVDDCLSKEDKGKRDSALANVFGGAPLFHTHAPSHAHVQVDTDDNEVFTVSNFKKGDNAPKVSGDSPNCSNISKASIASFERNNEKITKTKPLVHQDDNSRYGRKIEQANPPSGATEVGVVGSLQPSVTNTTTLEPSKEPRSRPFFFLPSEDEEEASHTDSADHNLRSDPDLYPIPKNGGSSHHSSTSPKDKPRTPVSPPSPQKQSPPADGSVEIKNRIRYCLQRARSRSTSLGGLGSFEAGLYRLEGLLDGKKDDGHSKDNPAHPTLSGLPSSKQRPAEHVAALMPKYKDTGTITDVCSGDNVAEVELISLVQEQFPRYILRADTVTEFSGYDNADWGVSFPALKEEEVEALSPEQAEGALAYFDGNECQSPFSATYCRMPLELRIP